MADDSQLGIKITAESKDAEAGIERVDDKIRHLPIAVQEAMESFGAMRRTLVEAFALREIAELIQHVAELGEAAIRSSEMLGISVEKVQELGFAARMVGGSSESMNASLTRLERNMAEVGNATSKASQSFAALGISEQDIKDKSPDQVLGMIANAFAGAKDGADKTAIAMDLMGRGGAQMIPLLNQGSDGLERMGVIAKQTGAVLNEVQAEGLEQTAQKLTTLKTSTEGAGIAFVELLKPAIDGIIDGLTQLVQWATWAINEIRLLAVVIESALARAILDISELFDKMRIRATEGIEAIKISFTALGQVIDDVAHGHVSKAADDWVEATYKIAEANMQAGASVAHISTAYDALNKKLDVVRDNMLNFAGAQEKAGKTQLHAPIGGGAGGKEDHTERDLAREEVAFEAQMGKLKLANAKDILDEKVAMGEISKQKEFQQLQALADQEYAIDRTALENASRIDGLTVVEKQKINDQLLLLDQKYANQKELLTLKSLDEEKKQYDKFFNTIQTGIDQMVNGILQGTQTWQQAMGRLFDNLAIKFIDDVIVKMVLRWAESEAMKLGITQTFNNAMIALGLESAATDAAGQHAIMAAANVATVTADGALTFAGVMANLSPLMGPAAAGPAAASQALVMGMAPMASLDVGAWSLKSDMVAQLHQGEMVVPKTFAEGMRGDGGMGGGDVVNITIQALDTQTGTQFLKNNIGTIVSQLSQQKRLNNPAMHFGG